MGARPTPIILAGGHARVVTIAGDALHAVTVYAKEKECDVTEAAAMLISLGARRRAALKKHRPKEKENRRQHRAAKRTNAPKSDREEP